MSIDANFKRYYPGVAFIRPYGKNMMMVHQYWYHRNLENQHYEKFRNERANG